MARRLPEEERRHQILEAAKGCFVARGFAASRMEDVAAAAGLSKGGLYFHYRSKDDLMVAVVQRENDLVGAFLDHVAQSMEPLPEQIQRLLGYYFRYLTLHVDAARINQCVLDEALRNPKVADLVRQGEDLFFSRLATILGRARQNGQLPETLDVELATRAAMIVIEGVKTKYLHFPEWPWDRLLSQVQRLVVEGILGVRAS